MSLEYTLFQSILAILILSCLGLLAGIGHVYVILMFNKTFHKKQIFAWVVILEYIVFYAVIIGFIAIGSQILEHVVFIKGAMTFKVIKLTMLPFIFAHIYPLMKRKLINKTISDGIKRNN